MAWPVEFLMLAGMWPGQLNFNVGRHVAWPVEFLMVAGMWPGQLNFNVGRHVAWPLGYVRGLATYEVF